MIDDWDEARTLRDRLDELERRVSSIIRDRPNQGMNIVVTLVSAGNFPTEGGQRVYACYSSEVLAVEEEGASVGFNNASELSYAVNVGTGKPSPGSQHVCGLVDGILCFYYK
jgi:hypothetical protein